MRIDTGARVIWIRVPGGGSTTCLRHFRGKYSFQEIRDDHDTYATHKKNGHLEGREGFKVIVNLRNPYDWLQTLYRMCKRAPRHWVQFVGPKDKHADIEYFLNNVPTQIEWAGGGDVEVIVVEKLDEQRQNVTNVKDKEDFEWTDERKAIVEKRFHRELEYYK